MNIDDQQFEAIISRALDELPQKYIKNMNNVAIVYEDEPNAAQRQALALRCNETLFGLYQGVPLPARGAGYNLVLPDKITIFKQPLLASSFNEADLHNKVKHTLWHEIAHHFGLDHQRIHYLENKRLAQNS